MRAGPHLQLSQGARHACAALVLCGRRADALNAALPSPQAFAILDEIVMGGAVFETSSLEALRAFNETQRRASRRRRALHRLLLTRRLPARAGSRRRQTRWARALAPASRKTSSAVEGAASCKITVRRQINTHARLAAGHTAVCSSTTAASCACLHAAATVRPSRTCDVVRIFTTVPSSHACPPSSRALARGSLLCGLLAAAARPHERPPRRR